MSRAVWWGIIAVFAVLALAGWLFASRGSITNIQPVDQKKPDTDGNRSATSTLDVSRWKTYSNDIYKFEVKYPPDWIAESISREGLALFVAFSPQSTSTGFYMGLGIAKGSLDEARKLIARQPQVVSVSDASIGNGISALRAENMSTSSKVRTYTYLFAKQGNVFSLYGGRAPSSEDAGKIVSGKEGAFYEVSKALIGSFRWR